MAAVSAAAYVRVQAAVAGFVNVLVNPAIDWLSSRHKGAQPLWSADGLVINFVATSLILSLLVAVFAGFGAGHELRSGRVVGNDGTVAAPRWLTRSTARPWLLGLIFGAAAAVAAVVACWLFDALGVQRLSLGWLMAVKAVYCGLLGFAVARWVILRWLAAAGHSPKPNSRS